VKPTARCAQGLRLTKRSFSRDDRLARDGARMHTGSNSRSLMVSSPPPARVADSDRFMLPTARGQVRGPPRKGQGGIRPLGGRGNPPVGIGIGRGWWDPERRRRGWTIIAIPTGEKSKRAWKEGRTDVRTHARDFERASYVARIASPILPRGRRREGVDRRESSSTPGRRG
jgi:hypothetical protein